MRPRFFAFALGFVEALRKLAVGALTEAFGDQRWHRIGRCRQLVEQTTILLKARALQDLGHLSGCGDGFLIDHQILHADCLHDTSKGTRRASTVAEPKALRIDPTTDGTADYRLTTDYRLSTDYRLDHRLSTID